MKKIKITKRWLCKNYACEEAVEDFCKQKERDVVKLVKLMIKKKKYRWASWLIVKVLEDSNRLRYVIHAAESVLHIYEDAYPDSDEPRKAIYAAKMVLKVYDGKTKIKTEIFSNATYASKAASKAAATSAAGCAAGTTAGCACGCAAGCAADSTATYATSCAIYAASYSLDALADRKLQAKIVRYGLSLLKNEDKYQKEETDERL